MYQRLVYLDFIISAMASCSHTFSGGPKPVENPLSLDLVGVGHSRRILSDSPATHAKSLPPCLCFLEPCDAPDPSCCPLRFLPPLPSPPPPENEVSSSPPSIAVSMHHNHTAFGGKRGYLTIHGLAHTTHQVHAHLWGLDSLSLDISPHRRPGCWGQIGSDSTSKLLQSKDTSCECTSLV